MLCIFSIVSLELIILTLSGSSFPISRKPFLTRSKNSIPADSILSFVLPTRAFEVSISEIAKAREEKISDLDISVMDDEFLACITSEVGKEFEDLLPEYLFEGGSICRTQYELDCGMVVTEKSMGELRKLCGK